MKVVLPRLATRKQKRKMRRFLNEVIARTDYPLSDLDVTVKFTFLLGGMLRYIPEKRVVTCNAFAWNSGRAQREGWLGTLAHELVGHAVDFLTFDLSKRQRFFREATGLEPNETHSIWGQEWPSHLGQTQRTSYWGAELWYHRPGELFADCMVEAFTDFNLNRNSNPAALQVTPELVALVREMT